MKLDPKHLEILKIFALPLEERGNRANAANEGRDDEMGRALELVDRVVPELEHMGLVVRIPIAIIHHVNLPFGSIVVTDPGPSGIAVVSITDKGRELLTN